MTNLKLCDEEMIKELKTANENHVEHVKQLKSLLDMRDMRISMLVQKINKQKHDIIRLLAELENLDE